MGVDCNTDSKRIANGDAINVNTDGTFSGTFEHTINDDMDCVFI